MWREKKIAHLQGTREWAFTEILNWWLDDPASPQLFWLTGGGGTGNSMLSEVKSVAIWDGGQGDGKDGGKNIDQSKSLLKAGFQDGTIKVWDSGAPRSQNRPSLDTTDAWWLLWQATWSC